MDVRRTGGSQRLKEILSDLEKREVRVGFFDTSHYEDGTPIAYVAAIQEFGYGPIPPRPFMRPAAEANKSKWAKGFASVVRSVVDGGSTVDHALEQIGMVAAGDVRKAIKAVTAPALKESTIRARQSRKKGKKAVSQKPLVDSGQMLQAVNSAVVTT